MDSPRLSSSKGPPFTNAIFVSAAVGALFGLGYAFAVADGSAFVVWVAPGAALVGAFAGADAMVVGMVAYRALRRFGRIAVPRLGAIVGATVTAGVIVFAALVVVKSVYTAETVIGVMVCVAIAALFATVPLERSLCGRR